MLVVLFFIWQRLSGASLLILANKQDIKGALAPEEIAKVSLMLSGNFFPDLGNFAGIMTKKNIICWELTVRYCEPLDAL